MPSTVRRRLVNQYPKRLHIGYVNLFEKWLKGHRCDWFYWCRNMHECYICIFMGVSVIYVKAVSDGLEREYFSSLRGQVAIAASFKNRIKSWLGRL